MLRALALVSGVVAFAGCSGDLEDPEAGSAVANIAVVPADVACVRITVSGPSRSADRFFNVTAGQSAILSMTGLPTGQDTFLGRAYSGVCTNVGATTVANWSSDPAIVSLQPGTTATVSLKLSHSGDANVTVDFVDDAGVGDGAVDLAHIGG
jgi:hypothetical protein